jgi:hypothetical protein
MKKVCDPTTQLAQQSSTPNSSARNGQDTECNGMEQIEMATAEG